MSRISDDHPLARLLRDLIHNAVVRHVASRGLEDAEEYLTHLMLHFLRTDHLMAIKDRSGMPIQSLTDLIEAGDICMGADSFERERQVHKHLGDLLLFGLGIYPEIVAELASRSLSNRVLQPMKQGQESYAIVSTFDHGVWAKEASTFSKLSSGFEDFAWVLGEVGRTSGLVHRA